MKSRDPKQGKKPSKNTPQHSAPGVEREMKPTADHGEHSSRDRASSMGWRQGGVVDEYFFMVQAALPHMKRGAVILNAGSVTALRGNATLFDYSATKRPGLQRRHPRADG